MVNGKAVESSAKENVQIENLIEDKYKIYDKEFDTRNESHSPSSQNGQSSTFGLQPEEFHFMLADHEGGKRHYSESCEDEEDYNCTNEGSNNESNIFSALDSDCRMGTDESSRNWNGRAWNCYYCHHDTFITSEQFNGLHRYVFKCSRCGKDCLYANSLLLSVKNPVLSHELKGRLLWEAYFQEIPSEDFNDEDIPRWKQSSLNFSTPSALSDNKISIEEAVRMVFNHDKFDCPVWNKRYLRAFHQWITDYPEQNQQSILVNIALEMGIEHVRSHSSSEVFFSNGRNYFLIDYNLKHMSEKRSSESKLIKNNYKKRLYGDGFETQKSHYTLDENIDLIRGINFIGIGKWQEILSNPVLKFSECRTTLSLKQRSIYLDHKLRIINSDGRRFRVLPGYEERCMQPIPVIEASGIIKQASSKEPLVNVSSYKRVVFTVEEDVDLIRGINFIGAGKWQEILSHPSLKFSKVRTSLILRQRSYNLEKKLLSISLEGKSYKVLPGLEEQCVKPISTCESSASSENLSEISQSITVDTFDDAREYFTNILCSNYGDRDIDTHVKILTFLLKIELRKSFDFREIMVKYFSLRDLLLCLAHKLLGDKNWPEYRKQEIETKMPNGSHYVLPEIAVQCLYFLNIDSENPIVFKEESFNWIVDPELVDNIIQDPANEYSIAQVFRGNRSSLETGSPLAKMNKILRKFGIGFETNSKDRPKWKVSECQRAVAIALMLLAPSVRHSISKLQSKSFRADVAAHFAVAKEEIEHLNSIEEILTDPKDKDSV